jgi:hypothetical protein
MSRITQETFTLVQRMGHLSFWTARKSFLICASHASLKYTPGISETFVEINELQMGFGNSGRASLNGMDSASWPVAADVNRRISDDSASRLLAQPVLRTRRIRRLTAAATRRLELDRTHSHSDFVFFIPFCATFFIFLSVWTASTRAIFSFLFGRVYKTRSHFRNDFATN